MPVAIIFFFYMIGVVSVEKKIDYDACKKEGFKPAVCERYKALRPPSER